MVLKGCIKAAVDPKGRITLPGRCREALETDGGSVVVVTVDLREQCLLLYSAVAWRPIETALDDLPNIDERYRRLQRMMLGHATEVEIDGSGRVLLPSDLREYAGLDKRVAVVGQGNKFELWSEENWDARRIEWRRQAAEDLQSMGHERVALLDRI